MANPLTGGFDALIQVAVSQINGILATLHQNGAGAATTLKLLHEVRTRVGDLRGGRPHATAFGDWLLEYQEARPDCPRRPIRDLLVGTLPPGVALRAEAAFKDLDAVLEPAPPDVVRGSAYIQVSTIRITVADGSTSEVTIHADIRARYTPDPGTSPLPADITGEVRAAYEVRMVTQGTKTRLRIRPSTQDEKITFIPTADSGLSVTDAVKISTQVRRLLREGVVLVPVELPEGFPFAGFRGLGGGGSNIVALPLQLSENPPPAAGVQGITQSFIGPSGFGFAIAHEYVEGLIDPVKIAGEIEKRKIRIHVSVLGYSDTVTYSLKFTSGPTLTFRTGDVEISGSVSVKTGTWWAPNGWVSFKQRITLDLDTAAQRIDVVTAGDPSVSESLFIPHGTAVNAVKNGIAEALAGVRPTVRHVFDDARHRLVNALQTFEASASATYTQVNVLPDGVVVRGHVGTASRIAPVVAVEEVSSGLAFSAFHSWIPGGRIDRFTWSWVEYPTQSAAAWSGVAKLVTETNRFLLDKPPGVEAVGEMCLRIEGERILPDGRSETIDGGSICLVPAPVIGIEAPSWWGPVTVPHWKRDLPATARLRDGIAAHIAVQTDRPSRELTQNALVFFPDWRSSAPFETLAGALQMMRHRASAALFVVLPTEALDLTRREVEERLAPILPRIAARVQVVEDAEHGWSRTFDVKAVPAIFLINARREFVWKSENEMNPAAIAAALDALIVPGPRPRFQPLCLKVAVGDRAPDVIFRDDRGEDGALHRFLGRSVHITFWQSWSAPCLEELRRLESLQRGDQRSAPAIVAFHGGPAPESFEEIRRRNRLSFPIVDDAEHRIARTFGVRCWPTTIGIDAEGRIDHVQLGAVQERGRSAVP